MVLEAQGGMTKDTATIFHILSRAVAQAEIGMHTSARQISCRGLGWHWQGMGHQQLRGGGPAQAQTTRAQLANEKSLKGSTWNNLLVMSKQHTRRHESEATRL